MAPSYTESLWFPTVVVAVRLRFEIGTIERQRVSVLKLVEAVEPLAAWALGNNLAPRFFVRKIWEHNNLSIRCTAS